MNSPFLVKDNEEKELNIYKEMNWYLPFTKEHLSLQSKNVCELLIPKDYFLLAFKHLLFQQIHTVLSSYAKFTNTHKKAFNQGVGGMLRVRTKLSIHHLQQAVSFTSTTVRELGDNTEGFF